MYIQHKNNAGSALKKCGKDPDELESNDIPAKPTGLLHSPSVMIDLTTVIVSRR